MKLIFAGTPEFAIAPLKAIVEGGHEVVAVLTQPDKPQGRKGILTPSPVKAWALERGIPVLQPKKLKEDFSALSAFGAPLMVTCAYGQILTQEILDIFPMGVWNIHASLLPAYRGAAPIARCIIDGAKETGITVMKTDVGLDTGDMLLCERVSIEEEDTCGSLSEKLSRLGASCILSALEKIENGSVVLTKQGEGFTCKKVCREEVDFSQTAQTVANLINGLSPAPLAFATVEGLTLNFYAAKAIAWEGEEAYGTVLTDSPKQGFLVRCGEGAVQMTELQPAGGKRMSAQAFMNGRKVKKGARFEDKSLL